ncbi:MAG: multiheme c-type cytochrome [Myxococcota bacterium]
MSHSAIVFWMMAGCSTRPPVAEGVETPPPTLADARAFYAAQPQMLRPFPYTPTPAGLTDLRAETCGSCHQEIYAEWTVSTHAHAWEGDPQFQAELHKSTQPDSDVGWMCVNCHTPLENQLPKLVGRLEGGARNQPVYVDNPNFDRALQLEAITCAGCHVRDGVILGPWGDSAAPHPVKKSERLLSADACTQCHQANAHFPELTLACMFNTGEEWANSPAAAEGQRCQSCHMPEVERPVVPWGQPRQTRRHWFGGSLIPKTPADAADLKPLEDVYPEGMSVSWAQLPDALTAGAQASVSVRYINDAAGHWLPSGDPERFILVTLRARDAQGAVLAEAEAKIGKVVEWYPEIRVQSDNRLKPGEARELSLAFTPTNAGPVQIEVEASKWRITEENLAYHDLQGEVVPGRVFFSDVRPLAVR